MSSPRIDLTEFDGGPGEELAAVLPPDPLDAAQQGSESTRTSRGWSVIASRASFVIAALILLLVILWSLFPGVFTSQNPVAGVPEHKLLGPSSAHWLGTDYLGRDLYARVVYGSRQSVSAALVAVGIALVVGTVVGLLAGYFARVVDSILSRITDALLAIPSLLLAMLLVASLGFKTINVAIAVGISSIALFARLIRSEVVRVRNLTFVESAEVVGSRPKQVLLEHVLPHVVPVAFSMSVLQFGYATLAISSLAFLGFGSPPPTPDWGLIVAEGKDYMATDPWLVVCPSIVVVVVVLAFQRLSQGYSGKVRA